MVWCHMIITFQGFEVMYTCMLFNYAVPAAEVLLDNTAEGL